MVNFVFLVKYFDRKVVIFTKFLSIQLDLLQHTKVYHNTCSLTRPLLFRSQIFYCCESVSVNFHLVRTGYIPVFISKLSDKGIKFSLFLQLSFILRIGLVFGRNYPQFLLVIAVHGFTGFAKILGPDAIKEVAATIVAFLIKKWTFVDHPRLIIPKNYNSFSIYQIIFQHHWQYCSIQ